MNSNTKNKQRYHVTISGDIVASTAINEAGKNLIDKKVKELFAILKKKFEVFGRIIKGDYLEFYVPNIEQILRVALIIKTFFKSLEITQEHATNDKKRFRYFTQYGIRLAIGIGNLNRLDLDKGIIDGEAIYRSGRTIEQQKTYNKEKISIKKTLFFVSGNEELNDEMLPVLELIDTLINKCTAKQSKVIYLKLLEYTESDIIHIENKAQSTINHRSNTAGWPAIETTLSYFEKTFNRKLN